MEPLLVGTRRLTQAIVRLKLVRGLALYDRRRLCIRRPFPHLRVVVPGGE